MSAVSVTPQDLQATDLLPQSGLSASTQGTLVSDTILQTPTHAVSNLTASQPSLLRPRPLKTQPQKGCDWTKGAKAVAVAVAIVSLIAGVIGLLVYLGQLQIGLTNVGSMTQSIGLYTMLGGFGATFITTLLMSVACCLSRAKVKGAQPLTVPLALTPASVPAPQPHLTEQASQ